MKDRLLLKLIAIVEKGKGLSLHDKLLKKIAGSSRSEVFRVGRARSGGEKDSNYVYYRTVDSRGNYKVEYFEMNGKTEELLSVYSRGISDWVYLGSCMIRRIGKEYQAVNHEGPNERRVIDKIRKAVSSLDKSDKPNSARGEKPLLERIVSKTRTSQKT